MDDLLLKYNEYMRLDGFRLEYEMYNGIRIEVTYKEENFAHLLGLHKLKDIQIIQFWQDRSNKTVKLSDVIRHIKRGRLTDAIVRSSYFFPMIKERYENFSYDNLTSLNYTDAIIDFNPALIQSKIKSDYILFEEDTKHEFNHMGIAVDKMGRDRYIETFFHERSDKYIARELFLLAVLFYLKYHLIQPFHRMQDMTYELSKGNLQGDVKADKNQYFGKFLWGLSELKDALRVSRKRELELQREKKLLLLSLSHDIKTPLNMIKLYAKALEDGISPTAGEREKAYHQIGEKAVQIENFVGEIIRASKQDIVRIEVEQGVFYLKDLVQWMEAVYGEKCALRKCAFTVGDYQNRIFQGDLNRLMEVFENLFENAFKYGDGCRIQISFYEEDYCQLIRVFNTGEPVSEKEFVHLFDSFFRGENTKGQQGNGLGLYICREIMLKMNGEIFAVCEPDGMAFVVVLPI